MYWSVTGDQRLVMPSVCNGQTRLRVLFVNNDGVDDVLGSIIPAEIKCKETNLYSGIVYNCLHTKRCDKNEKNIGEKNTTRSTYI